MKNRIEILTAVSKRGENSMSLRVEKEGGSSRRQIPREREDTFTWTKTQNRKST